MRRKMRATTDLAKKGTKFSSYLKRVRDEVIINMEDGGRMRRMFSG